MVIVPIVFTIEKSFLTPTYVAIKSLVENAAQTTAYDIIILYQGKENNDIKKIASIVDKSRHTISVKYIAGLKMNAPIFSNIWPSIIYARLYLASILTMYDKVIYSDVDVFFLGDLAKVFFTDINGYEWGGVAAEKNDKDTIIHQHYDENKHSYIYWSGFMLMNLKEMRKNNWVERCNCNIEKCKDRLFMYDLEILNLTAKNIKRLPLRYVYLQALYDTENIKDTEEWKWLSKIYSEQELKEEKKNAVIVHYAGRTGKELVGKPWLRLHPPSYYNAYLKKIPFSFRLKNNVRRFIKTGKVFVKVILENILH